MLMDSPGFQSFGLQHVSASQLADAFAEFRALHGHCKFYNCTHLHEPGCAVLADLSQGHIAQHRHTLYKQVFEELKATVW
jgi:ribosome biogenesis GTPase